MLVLGNKKKGGTLRLGGFITIRTAKRREGGGVGRCGGGGQEW